MSTCTIRKDLQEEHLAIPVGSGYVCGNRAYEYKWESLEDFFIKVDGEWLEAQSLDFDFNQKQEVDMEHTKAPWQVGNLVENDHEPRHVEIKGDDGIKLISKAFYGQTDEECATNAHLIASAPELLEACKYVVQYHRENDSGEGELYGLDFVTTCICAISKAEGRG